VLLCATHEQKVTIPVFPFKEALPLMLMDLTIINDENFHDTHFNKDTLRPTGDYNTMGTYAIIDGIYHGTLYQKVIDIYCNGKVPNGVDLILPLPCILYTDESFVDRKGGNTTSPFALSFAMIKSECRALYCIWLNFAFGPNLHVCKVR